MKRPNAGTERPRAFAVEAGSSWKRWARRRTKEELDEINIRLGQLQEGFGKPHLHAGLGLRRLSPRFFEFRISKGIRVVFALLRPDTFQLAMTGNHDEVRAWLRANL